MSRKPESVFRSNVNRQLRDVFKQSNVGSMMALSGVPDQYYDGPFHDLWVEYKFNPTMPRNGIVVGNYSALQLHWMKRRYENSVPDPNIVGIVGLPKGLACIQFTPDEWTSGTPATTAMPISEVACWIRNFCGVSSKPVRQS